MLFHDVINPVLFHLISWALSLNFILAQFKFKFIPVEFRLKKLNSDSGTCMQEVKQRSKNPFLYTVFSLSTPPGKVW